jgi:FG-GAP-like repeat/Matrixin
MPRHLRSWLNLENLNARIVPAVNLRFDYSLDTAGFFSDPVKREALEKAGAEITSRLDNDFAAISPQLGNSWSILLDDPATGQQREISNPTIAANTIIVYAGARLLEAAEAGEGGFGGYRAGGDSNWLRTIQTRGQAGFSLWGGSISFDLDQNWDFTQNAPKNGQTDFHTVAVHELTHLLGFGTADQFKRLTNGSTFTGSSSVAANGGQAPQLSADRAHWAQGTKSNGQEASLQPFLVSGKQYGLSDIDLAALKDIGWTILSSATSPPPVSAPQTPAVPTIPVAPPVLTPVTPPVVPPVVPPVAPPVVPPRVPPVVPPTVPVVPPTIPPVLPPTSITSNLLSISTGNGMIQLYAANANGTSTPVGNAYYPFGGGGGSVRSTLADVNGDGTPDLIATAGPGGGSQIRVIDGKTNADIGSTFSAFEFGFTGGLFVTAADIDRDGKADVIVSPDEGGGGRVTVYSFANGTPRIIANFFGIADTNFRGGARVASADVNGDGTPDVIVGAGFGGGPRVAIFDGTSVARGNPTRLVNDFFAFGGTDVNSLRNGIYISSGDFDGDGRAEIVFAGGPGGGPRVQVLSGSSVLSNPVAAVANPMMNFFAFDSSQRGGVRPAIRDVNGDGKLDLIVGSGAGTNSAVKVFNAANPNDSYSLNAFGFGSPADGIYVG